VANLEVDTAAERADGEVDDCYDANRDVHADSQCRVDCLQTEKFVTARVLVDNDEA